MAERLIDVDAYHGGVAKTYFDDNTFDVRIDHVVDTTSILDSVKAEQAVSGGKTENLWHIGRINVAQFEGWARLRGLPPGAIYDANYSDEVLKFILEHKALSPTEGKH